MSFRILLVSALLIVGYTASAHDQEHKEIAKKCPELASWISKQPHHKTPKQLDSGHTFSKPKVRSELLTMARNDQRERAAMIKAGSKNKKFNKAVQAGDAKRLRSLKKIIRENGFPTRGEVGAQGISSLWLLVQHADRDPAFQEYGLRKLKGDIHGGGISAQDYAMLTDRVLLAEHKKQRYGTQFDVVKGALKVSPLANPTNVNVRRRKIGLPPMKEYKCFLRMEYAPVLRKHK